MAVRQPMRPNADGDWEPYYSAIRKLWWDDDQTLSELMLSMQNEHGFVATEKQYKRMLEKWDLGKNVKNKEMRAIVKILLSRHPKETEFKLRDRPVPKEKIDRFLLRTVGTLAPSLSAFSPIGFTPCQLRYYTPKATYQPGSRCVSPKCSSPGTPISDGWMNDFIHMSDSPISTIHSDQNPFGRIGSTTPTATPTLLSSSLSLPPEDIVAILTEHHSGIRESPFDLFRVFCWAVAEGNHGVKSQVLKQRLILSPDWSGVDAGNLIHFLTSQGESEFLHLLLGNGADPNIMTEHGRTPLQLAVAAGKGSIVKLLLDKRADPNVHRDIRTKPPLHQAIAMGNVPIVRKLLLRGASTSLPSPIGEIPLHLAIDQDETMTQLVLDAGATVMDIDHNGDTALHRAVKANNLDIVCLLRSRAAPFYILNRHGYAPLHCAVAQGNLGITEYLIDGGADKEYRTTWGDLPLHIAINIGSSSPVLVRALLDKGVCVSALGKEGRTAAECTRRLLSESPADKVVVYQEVLSILEAAESGGCWCTVCITGIGEKNNKCKLWPGAENQGDPSWFDVEQSPTAWGSSVDCTF